MTIVFHDNRQPPITNPLEALVALGAGQMGWHHFSTGSADAYVCVNPMAPGTYLLHQLDSAERGHGTAIMNAIGEWADENMYHGTLVCDLATVGFYARFGWVSVGRFIDDDTVRMAR